MTWDKDRTRMFASLTPAQGVRLYDKLYHAWSEAHGPLELELDDLMIDLGEQVPGSDEY